MEVIGNVGIRCRKFSEEKAGSKSMSMSPENVRENNSQDTSANSDGLNPSPPVKFPPRNISDVESRLLNLAKEKPVYRRHHRDDSSSDNESPDKVDKRKTKTPERQLSSPRSRKSGSPNKRSQSKERQKSPSKRRSRSPKRKTRSPDKRKTRSPDKRRTRSPDKGRTRSPDKRRTRSPNKRKTRSPDKRRSASPNKRKAKSPVKARSRSPKKRSPRSPGRTKASSPSKREDSRKSRSRSADKSRLKSRKSTSRSPRRRKHSRSPARRRSRSNERRRHSRSNSIERRRRSRSKSRGRGRSRSGSRDGRRSRGRRYSRSRSPSPMFTSKWGQKPAGICRAVLPANPDDKRTREVTTEDVEKRLAQHMQSVQQKAAEEAKKINLPGYLNPAMVNVHQFKQVQDKRKLLWSKAKDKKEGGGGAQWAGAFGDKNNDEKFCRLMGIQETNVDGSSSQIQESRKVLDDLEKEYEKSRAFQLSRGAGGLTGIGLGFGSAMQPQ